MANLLTETLEALEQNSKAPADVRWVGSIKGSHAIDWDAFAVIADFDYDDGYGGQEIAHDLVVVGGDWWLERHEYDGSEWWEFKTLPMRQPDAKTFQIIYRYDDRRPERSGDYVYTMNP